MSKYNFKRRAPKGFTYLLSPKEVKTISKELDFINSFQYLGVSPHNQIKDLGKEIWLGYVLVQRIEDEWQFNLGIYANQTKYLDGILENAKGIFLRETRLWCNKIMSLPETIVFEFNSFYLSVRNDNGIVKSTSIELIKTW